jgi:hypothetical protein
MKPDQAEKLLQLLRAAYPRTTLPDEASDLWLTRLRALDTKVGAKAVESLIDGVKFWPSLAELYEHYEIAREQAARVRRAEERRQQLEEFDAMELPPLAEILRRFPEVQKLVAGDDGVVGLPAEGRGECDECGTVRPMLYRLNKFRLCPRCARRRKHANAGGTNDEVAA